MSCEKEWGVTALDPADHCGNERPQIAKNNLNVPRMHAGVSYSNLKPYV